MTMFSTASRPWPLFFAVLLFVTATLAQTSDFNTITRPIGEIIPAGSVYQITWIPNPSKYPGPITITLIGGETTASLLPIQVIAVGVDGAAGQYDWFVDKSLGGLLPIFGIKFTWGEDSSVTQFSVAFQISGSGTSAASSLSSTIASSTTASTVPTASSSQTISDGAASSSEIISDGGKVEGKSSSSVPIVVPVVLGVVLGLVVLAALGWFLWRRNKKRKKTQGGIMVPELGDSGKDKAEQYGVVGELPAHEKPIEVCGEGARRVELE